MRALRVLREVSLIAAEDTRHTRKLLNHFAIATPTTSYHQHSAPSRITELLQALQHGDVALVTDAGTPGISDPGSELVAAAAQGGFTVVAIPGASALLTLAASSGMQAARFIYLGFLPRKGKERGALIERAAQTGWPFIIYESPQRLKGTLNDLLKAVGDRSVAVGRELTKLHEEVFRGTLTQATAYFGNETPRGEVTLMLGMAGDEARPTAEQAALPSLDEVLTSLQAQDLPAKQIARQAAVMSGVSTRQAYNRLMQLLNKE